MSLFMRAVHKGGFPKGSSMRAVHKGWKGLEGLWMSSSLIKRTADNCIKSDPS